MIFAHKTGGDFLSREGSLRECLRTHRNSWFRKQTALQNRRLSLGLDPQVVVVVEKLNVTDRLTPIARPGYSRLGRRPHGGNTPYPAKRGKETPE